MASGSISSAYFLIRWIQLRMIFSRLISTIDFLFYDWQKGFDGPNLRGTWGILYFWNNSQTAFFRPFLIFIWMMAWCQIWPNVEFWQIFFWTKFVLQSMKMDLQTSYVPFWNEMSVSNSLILSNLGFLVFLSKQ